MDNNYALVIFAFPGSGASSYYKLLSSYYNNDPHTVTKKIVDYSNITFSNIDEFKNDILWSIKNDDIVFLSTNAIIMKMFEKYSDAILFPDINNKVQWICRLEREKKDKKLIKHIEDNWEGYISRLQKSNVPVKIRLSTLSVTKSRINEPLMDYIKSQVREYRKKNMKI